MASNQYDNQIFTSAVYSQQQPASLTAATRTINDPDDPETSTLQILGIPNDIFSTQNLTFQFPRFMHTPSYDERLLEWATPIYPPAPSSSAAAAQPPPDNHPTMFTSSPNTDYRIHYPPHPHP